MGFYSQDFFSESIKNKGQILMSFYLASAAEDRVQPLLEEIKNLFNDPLAIEVNEIFSESQKKKTTSYPNPPLAAKNRAKGRKRVMKGLNFSTGNKVTSPPPPPPPPGKFQLLERPDWSGSDESMMVYAGGARKTKRKRRRNRKDKKKKKKTHTLNRNNSRAKSSKKRTVKVSRRKSKTQHPKASE